MIDEEMRQLCVRLKMPGIMFNSIGFRGHLIRLYHAARAGMVQCTDYIESGDPGFCDSCGSSRKIHPGESKP